MDIPEKGRDESGDKGRDDGPSQRAAAFKVALYALHDRKFFEELVTDPRAAIMGEGRLGEIGSQHVDYVVQLIEGAKGDYTLEDLLRKHDNYHETGLWDDLWPEEFLW